MVMTLADRITTGEQTLFPTSSPLMDACEHWPLGTFSLTFFSCFTGNSRSSEDGLLCASLEQMSFFNSKCASLSFSPHPGLHHWGISKSKQGGHKPRRIASCYRKRGERSTPFMGILNTMLHTNVTNRTFCIFIYFIPTAILDKLYEGENFVCVLGAWNYAWHTESSSEISNESSSYETGL